MSASDVSIIRDNITRAELTDMAASRFGDMVKGVVDVSRRIMAVGESCRHRTIAAAMSKTRDSGRLLSA